MAGSYQIAYHGAIDGPGGEILNPCVIVLMTPLPGERDGWNVADSKQTRLRQCMQRPDAAANALPTKLMLGEQASTCP